MKQVKAIDGLPMPRGRASARKNSYGRAGGSTQRDALLNQHADEVNRLNDKLWKMEVWEREEYLARLIIKADKDEEYKEIVSALVLQGRWFPEFEGAMKRLPRMRLTGGR